MFCWAFYIAGELHLALNEADTICVSNLHEGVTVPQLFERFGLITGIKVSKVGFK